MENTYDIFTTGELEAGIDKETAVNGLAKAFKVDLAKAEALITNAPKTIKKNVSKEQAQKLLAALKKIGCNARARPSQAAEVFEAPSASGTRSPEQSRDYGDKAGAPGGTGPHEYEPENPPGYKFRIVGKPDYGYIEVQIPAGETLKVEASAMAAMDTNIRMKTKLRGGFGRFLTGENLFLNEFTAENIPGEMGIAPGTPGDVSHQYLNGNTIYLQNSAYVASTQGVNVETKWQGLVKGFFSGESLFLIRCSGQGDLWFNTYGAIIEIDVNGDYVVDTGNIVAFTDGLDYRVSKVGGYKSLFFSGEGLVCRFSGQGKVWIQTRNAAAFLQWAHWFRPVRKRG